MIDLKNYAPQSPEFKLPKNVSFPRVIFEGAKDMDEIRKHLSGKFIAESVTNAKAVRFLDSYERTSIRANYSELMEDEQPKLETQLAEIEAQCKQLTKDVREKLQAVVTQIRDLVYQVKRGEKEVDLPSDTTVKMALCGHYLYYISTTHGSMGGSNCAKSRRFLRGTSRASLPIWKPTSRHSSTCWGLI